jgi:potassium efflux system protein
MLLRSFVAFRLLLACCGMLGAATAARADVALSQRSILDSAVQTSETLRSARSQIAQKIEALRQANAEGTDEQHQRDAAIGQLQSIDVLYARFQTVLDERRQLKDEESRTSHEAKALEDFGPSEAKPYSFLLAENLQAELASQKERESALTSTLKAARKSLEIARHNLDETRHKTWTTNPLLAETNGAWALSIEDLEELHAIAGIALKEAEIQNLELRVANAKSRQSLLKDKLKVVEHDVKFTSQDRDKLLGLLSAGEAKLREKRRVAEAALQEIEQQQRAKTEVSANNAPPTERAEQSETTTASQDATVAAWQRAAIATQRQIVLLDQRLDAYSTLRTMWKRRFQLANGEATTARLNEWLEEVDEFNKELADVCQACQYRGETPAEPALPPGQGPQYEAAHALAERQVNALRDLSAESLADLKTTQQSLDRFHDELKAKVPKAEQNWLIAPLTTLWDFEIAGEDDKAVTLGTVLILLSYIIGGMVIAAIISRVVRGRLLGRIGIHQGAADALRSILFYVLCIIFGFISFRVLNVPLAAFAFLGGAAAIAVGFGSQDIMNNFMSGIILLMEQPIRVGDVVDIGGVEGVVLHIGLRSTRLQTQTNHELIVPNKTLIDEQVTNLTLSNNIVKTSVAVTLERSVRIEPAKHDIMKLVFNHPQVIKSMRPLVLVKEVDNYWLIFEIHFWIQYTNFLEAAAIQSDILSAIGDHYRPLADDEKPAQSSSHTPTDDEPLESNVHSAVPSAPTEADALATMQKMGSAVIAKQLKKLGGLKIRAS